MNNNLNIVRFLQLIVTTLFLIIPYALIYVELNYESSDSYVIFLEYLIVYFISVVLFRLFSLLFTDFLIDKMPFSLFKVVLIIMIFLFISSLFVNPMTFLLFVTPLSRNILLHLFLLSLLPNVFFYLKNSKLLPP